MPVPLRSGTYEKQYLPSTKDETNEENRRWVLINGVLPASAYALAEDIPGEPVRSNNQKSAEMIATVIKEWNLADVDDPTKVADITAANILELSKEDYEFLNHYLNSKQAKDLGGVDNGLKEI
jgi:hypothetical protein